MNIAFLLFGFLFLLYWFYLRRRSSSTASWQSVPGRVTECQWVKSRDKDDAQQDLSLAYTYEVGGTSYSSRRVSIGPINEAQIARKSRPVIAKPTIAAVDNRRAG